MAKKKAKKGRKAVSKATSQKFKMKKDHNDSLKETEKHMWAVATIRNHNIRLLKMIEWVKENYSAYAKNVIIKLMREQIKNTDLYYKSMQDFK